MRYKILLALVLGMAISGSTYAKDSYSMNSEGRNISFTKQTGYPFIDQSGRLQVPFRIALESIGATVKWEDNMAIGTKDGIEVKVPIGEKYILVDGQKEVIDTAACNKEGITFLPIRAVMESFGYEVKLKNNILSIEANQSQKISIWINGKKVAFSNKTGYPFYDEGEDGIYVPAASVMKALNIGEITVDRHRIAALDNDPDLQVYPGRPVIFGNTSFRASGKAMEQNGIIYAPTQAFASALKYEVVAEGNVITLEKSNVKNEEILKYEIPLGLGKAKLTVQEVEALVGKPLDEVAAKINTVPDALQFLISAKFQPTSGDIKFMYQGIEWSINRKASTVYKQNKGNCGGTSNLMRYLLDGDYDELGYVAWHGDAWQGGHIFNYFKQDEKYYIIDFIQYNIGVYDRSPKVFMTEDLREYRDHCRSINDGDGLTLKVIYAFSAEEQMPIGKKNGIGRIVPEEYKDKITIIYEAKEEGKVIEYAPGPEQSFYPKAYHG